MPFGSNIAVSSIVLFWGRKFNFLYDLRVWKVVQSFIRKLSFFRKLSKTGGNCTAKSVLLRALIRGEPIYRQASSIGVRRSDGAWLGVVVTEDTLPSSGGSEVNTDRIRLLLTSSPILS